MEGPSDLAGYTLGTEVLTINGRGKNDEGAIMNLRSSLLYAGAITQASDLVLLIMVLANDFKCGYYTISGAYI